MLALVLYIGFKLDMFVRLIFAYVLVTYHEPLLAMGKFIVYFFRLKIREILTYIAIYLHTYGMQLNQLRITRK